MVAAITNVGLESGAPASSVRWGMLGRVREWLGQPASERRTEGVDEWPASAALTPALTRLALADLEFDRRAASVALRQALSAWRAAERRAVDMSAEPGDRERARVEIIALRADHQQRSEALRRNLVER